MDNSSSESYDNFKRHLALAVVFFVFTPVVILTSLFSLVSLANSSKGTATIINPTRKSGVSLYASLPSNLPTISSEIVGFDGRSEILRQYLISFNSPLEPYADILVSVSDKYDLDYRLLTAIAQQESNLCKLIPPGSHNCWGWGIHSKGTLGFNSFEEAINAVARGIKEDYIEKGYTTIEGIMSKYTPLSDGSWAFGVNKFMEEMEQPE